MKKSDIHAVLFVLWLIAASIQDEKGFLVLVCASFSAWYAISSFVRIVIGVFKK